MSDAPGPPRSVGELQRRALLIAGRELAELAGWSGREVPRDLSREKGWMGSTVERALGVAPDVGAGPDLPHLGIEVKTIGLTDAGRPRESTWVCAAPMTVAELVPWARSPVRAKLAHVLWVPLLGGGPPGGRRVGRPVLWRPSPAQEEVLVRDWDTLTGMLAEGEVHQWTAHHGVALQLRPKAARGSDTTWVTDAEGEWVRTMPLGFYLRTRFTAEVIGALR